MTMKELMSSPEERIAGRIQKARKDANLTQAQVARRLREITDNPNFSTKTYERWERLESFTFMTNLDEIAEAIGTTRANLLMGENLTKGASYEELLQANFELSQKVDAIWLELKRISDALSE